jgi:hypothetical protein
LKRFGAAVARRLDRELVSCPEGQIAAVLTSDLLDVFDEAVEIELLGLRFESFEIENDPGFPLFVLARLV